MPSRTHPPAIPVQVRLIPDEHRPGRRVPGTKTVPVPRSAPCAGPIRLRHHRMQYPPDVASAPNLAGIVSRHCAPQGAVRDRALSSGACTQQIFPDTAFVTGVPGQRPPGRPGVLVSRSSPFADAAQTTRAQMQAPRSPQGAWAGENAYSGLIFDACLPLGPVVTSKETVCPSLSDLKPPAWIAEK